MKGKNPPPLRATLVIELLAQDTSRLNTQRFKSRLDFFIWKMRASTVISTSIGAGLDPVEAIKTLKLLGKKQPSNSLAKIYSLIILKT